MAKNRDFHPQECAHAGRTNEKIRQKADFFGQCAQVHEMEVSDYIVMS